MAGPRIRLSATIAVALALLGPATAQAQGDDPGLAEADALLADADGYPRAIALYREHLASQPDADAVRLRLARALAWSRHYDESLGEYDRLLAADAPPAGADVERAEVLSWSGRLDEAADAFESILDADPENARAARGLARVHRWAGRLGRAEQHYGRALALEEDAEARGEYDRLRAGWQPWLGARTSFIDDSDSFRRLSSEIEAAPYRSASTTLRVRSAYHRVSHPQGGVPASLRSPHSTDWAAELAATAEQRFEPEWLDSAIGLELETGARLWHHAPDSVFGHARLTLSPWAESSLALEAGSRGHLDESESFEALQQGLRASGTEVSLWRGWSHSWESFTRFGLLWIDDGNRRQSGDLTLSYRPFASRESRLHLGGSWMRYEKRSPAYYDPSSDLGVMLRASDRLELAEGLSFEPSAGLGYGRAKDGVAAGGLAYEVAGELGWSLGPWHVSAYGGYSLSRRARRYTTTRALLRITRSFSP